MSVHTDDLDCACEDIRDGRAILAKLHDRFGIDLCNEKYMLGVNRERWTENGIMFNRLAQAAYIEEAWEDYGKYRKGKRTPTKPNDVMSWLEATHGAVKVDEDEYERVKQRGYRSIVGTLLWPARNCYPYIQLSVGHARNYVDAWTSLQKQLGKQRYGRSYTCVR
eukprot:COSAG02_NODE_871_length_16337_cov_7.124276_7_plen_165_part_00